MRPTERQLQRGFTLIEAIMVIVISGILFASIGMFMRLPMAGAIDTARRAGMVDIADTALQRLRRDLRTALPNSVRVNAAGTLVEFLPTLAGGRYCDEPDSGATCSNAAGSNNNPLDFYQSDSSFEVIGPLIKAPSFTATGAYVAVYNLGIPGADAYSLENMSPISSVSAGTPTVIGFSSHLFPFASPARRFHIVGAPVSYACSSGTSGSDGSGLLRRYTGYALQATQPSGFGAASPFTLASYLSACTFHYTPAAIERDGLLSIRIQIKQQDETVSLTHEIQISNTP